MGLCWLPLQRDGGSGPAPMCRAEEAAHTRHHPILGVGERISHGFQVVD